MYQQVEYCIAQQTQLELEVVLNAINEMLSDTQKSVPVL